MLSYTLMGLADTLMVARLGTSAVAGVGIASTGYFAIVCFGMGLLNGVRVVVAQATGAQVPARARAAAHLGLMIAVVLGLVVLAMLPLVGPIMHLMGGGGVVAAIGSSYLSVRLFDVIPAFISIACFGWFEGKGETRVPMVVRIGANVVNVALDYVFIFGLGPIPAMGPVGAAYATVIALSLQGSIALALLWSRTNTGERRFSLDGLGELVRIGGPMGVQWALEVQSWAIFAALVARMGEAHLAAHTIVVRICSVSFLPGHAIGDATSILTGQAAGAGDRQAAHRAANSAMYVAVAIMGVMGVVFYLVPELLFGMFRAEPDVVAVGIDLMLWAAAFQLFDAVLMTRTGALNGVGDTRYVMVASVGMAWFQLLPVAWCLCNGLGYGAPGAWAALTLEILLLSAVMSARWHLVLRQERGFQLAGTMAE